MKNKNLDRVRRLYWGLFILVVCMVALTALNFFHGAAAGIDSSRKDMKDMKRPYHSVVDFDVKDGRELMDFGAPVCVSSDSTMKIYQRPYSYNVMVSGRDMSEVVTPKVAFSYILIFLGFGCQIAVFVLLFMILGSIRRSLKSGTVFQRSIVRYMKILGAMVIVSTVAADISMYLMHLNTIDLLEAYCPAAGVNLEAGVPVDSVPELFIGVVIMFLSEVFGIGYDMTEEQKLTI